MPAVLRQRRLFLTKRFEIKENALHVESSDLFNFAEWSYSFEVIKPKIVRKKTVHWLTAVPVVICILGLVVTITDRLINNINNTEDILCYLIGLLVFLPLTILLYENVYSLVLATNTTLNFYAELPDNESVKRFLDELRSKQKAYLISRYATLDPYLSHEQISNNLIWLRDKEFITEKELGDLRQELLTRQNTIQHIGFNFNAN